MFERFTDRARRTLVFAQEEARTLDHNFIGTEHILLGLMAEGEGVGAKVLTSFGLSLIDVRAQVLECLAQSGPKAEAPSKRRFTAKPPFTPKAKKVLELSLREALQLGHNYIGTEHILLGLIRTQDGVGAEALKALGVGAEEIRARVIETLKGHGSVLETPGRQMSAAASGTVAEATTLARGQAVTTGNLLVAMLNAESSHAARALAALGVIRADVETKLAEIPLDDTSDAPPRPQTVEIKLGPVSTVITDASLASALRTATAEEIEGALRDLVRRRTETGTETGTEG